MKYTKIINSGVFFLRNMHSPSFADVYAIDLTSEKMNLALPAVIASTNVKRTELWQVKRKPGFQISTDNNIYQQTSAAFKETVARTMFKKIKIKINHLSRSSNYRFVSFHVLEGCFQHTTQTPFF